MLRVVEVVARQVRDEGRTRVLEPCVQRCAEPSVLLEPDERGTGISQERLEHLAGLVARAVVDDEEFPVGCRLCEEAGKRAPDEGRAVERRHEHRDPRRAGGAVLVQEPDRVGCSVAADVARGTGRGAAPRCGDPSEHRQRLGDDLVHVVILVRREPPDEVHVGRRVRERLVALVELRVLGSRDRVVRVTLARGELVDDARLRVHLPGQVLELGDPRVLVLVRVVDDGDRLEDSRGRASRSWNSSERYGSFPKR